MLHVTQCSKDLPTYRAFMLNKLVLQGQYWGAWDSDGKAVCLDCEPGGRLSVWAALLPWRHSTCLRGDTHLLVDCSGMIASTVESRLFAQAMRKHRVPAHPRPKWLCSCHADDCM